MNIVKVPSLGICFEVNNGTELLKSGKKTPVLNQKHHENLRQWNVKKYFRMIKNSHILTAEGLCKPCIQVGTEELQGPCAFFQTCLKTKLRLKPNQALILSHRRKQENHRWQRTVLLNPRSVEPSQNTTEGKCSGPVLSLICLSYFFFWRLFLQ